MTVETRWVLYSVNSLAYFWNLPGCCLLLLATALDRGRSVAQGEPFLALHLLKVLEDSCAELEGGRGEAACGGLAWIRLRAIQVFLLLCEPN